MKLLAKQTQWLLLILANHVLMTQVYGETDIYPVAILQGFNAASSGQPKEVLINELADSFQGAALRTLAEISYGRPGAIAEKELPTGLVTALARSFGALDRDLARKVATQPLNGLLAGQLANVSMSGDIRLTTNQSSLGFPVESKISLAVPYLMLWDTAAQMVDDQIPRWSSSVNAAGKIRVYQQPGGSGLPEELLKGGEVVYDEIYRKFGQKPWPLASSFRFKTHPGGLTASMSMTFMAPSINMPTPSKPSDPIATQNMKLLPQFMSNRSLMKVKFERTYLAGTQGSPLMSIEFGRLQGDLDQPVSCEGECSQLAFGVPTITAQYQVQGRVDRTLNRNSEVQILVLKLVIDLGSPKGPTIDPNLSKTAFLVKDKTYGKTVTVSSGNLGSLYTKLIGSQVTNGFDGEIKNRGGGVVSDLDKSTAAKLSEVIDSAISGVH